MAHHLLALLRGINVGGHRKVPMADLRDMAEGLGFTDVRTWIQSGNLLMCSTVKAATAGKRLEAAIESHFGFAVDVVVCTAAQWAEHAAGNPFEEACEATPNLVLLGLSRSTPAAGAADAIRAKAANNERVQVVGDAIWLHFPEGSGRSKVTPAVIDKAVGAPTTTRNWKTVCKLRDMLAE